MLWIACAASAEPIRSIDIDNADVFDPRVPGEDIWPFRAANAIHIVTKRKVIKRELTFKEGDEWDAFRALESERLLRAYGSFRYVEISSSASGVKVWTQDAWSLNTRFSFGTEGGEDFLTYGVEERNLLGLNKQVSLLHHRKGPKKRDDLRYTDPRLFRTRFRMASLFARTNKGDSYGGDLTQPFYSLDTPHAVSGGYNRFIEEKIVYRDAEEYTRWVEREQAAQFALGGRLVADNTFVQRVESGWYASKTRYEATGDTRGGHRPAFRELSGPTVGYSWVQPQYVKETFVDSMERVEDYNMGNELRTVVGFMGTAFGSDRDRWIFNVSDQQGYRLAPGRFALAQVGVTGRSAGGLWDNTLMYANLNLFWRTGWPGDSIWVAHLEGNKGRNLDMGNQVILGGDTGLRGYRNNSFTGGQAALMNLENRFFFPGELFHLFRIGGVVFFDAGVVDRPKTDIGAGIRFVPTRGRTGTAFRVDVAQALQHGPGGKRWVVSIKGGQAFELFNSSTRRLKTTPASRLNEIAPPSFPELE